MMQGVDADGRNGLGWTPPPEDEQIERAIEDDQRDRARDRGRRPAPRDGEGPDHARGGAEPVGPAEIEMSRQPPRTKQERDPGHAPPREVAEQHRTKRPALEVRSLDGGLEANAAAVGSKAHPELDILDRRVPEGPRVETVDAKELAPSDRAESRPEGLHRATCLLVDVVVEEVAKPGDRSTGGRRLVVGADYGGGRRSGRERAADQGQRVAMDRDVGVDERKDLAAGAVGARVAGGGGTGVRRFGDHDQL